MSIAAYIRDWSFKNYVEPFLMCWKVGTYLTSYDVVPDAFDVTDGPTALDLVLDWLCHAARAYPNYAVQEPATRRHVLSWLVDDAYITGSPVTVLSPAWRAVFMELYQFERQFVIGHFAQQNTLQLPETLNVAWKSACCR